MYSIQRTTNNINKRKTTVKNFKYEYIYHFLRIIQMQNTQIDFNKRAEFLSLSYNILNAHTVKV